MRFITVFFYFTKTPKGDWNILKGGNRMSKRHYCRSKHRTVNSARIKQFKREEARKRAKHRKRFYYRHSSIPRCRIKGA